jgi:acetyltransferase-like isoleucine patch superfamily enzyme
VVTKFERHVNSYIGEPNVIEVPLLRMDDGAEIGSFNIIRGMGRVFLGKNAVVSDHCSILTTMRSAYGMMNEHAEPEYSDITDADIYIGENAFVGAYSTICPGVRLMPGAVVGVGSYIMKDVGNDVMIRFKALRLESERIWYKRK